MAQSQWPEQPFWYNIH